MNQPKENISHPSLGEAGGGFSVPQVGSGFYFGLCLFMIFTSRIFIEYTKENQVSFEDGMLFNMGQLLSVPFVLLGTFCMWRAWRKTT